MAGVDEGRDRQGKPWPVVPVALLLLLAGALLSSVTGVGTYLPRLLLLAGAVLILVGLIRALPTLRAFNAQMRRVAEPAPTITFFLLGAILLVLAVGLNVQRARVDLTSRGLHSLSETSRQVLSRLPSQVELIGVYRETDPDAEIARDVLDIYGTESRGIHTRWLDPERNPQEARDLRIDFHGGVLVLADSAREVVNELTEAALTQAILRVGDPRRPAAALLEGHGETGGQRSGIAAFRETLIRDGFEVRRLRLAETEDVPADVRVLFEIGPASPLLPGEIAALNRYLDRGGRLGLFLDPETAAGLEPVLAPRGILVDGRRVRDDGPLTGSVGLGPETIAVQSLGEHEVTRGLTSAIVLRGATRIGLAPLAVWGLTGTEILRSAPSARLLGPGPESPPQERGLPLGVALEWEVPGNAAAASPGGAGAQAANEKPMARLLLVGDSDFLRDETLRLYGNEAFARRVTGWLGEREFLLQFKPIDPSGTPLRVGLRGIRIISYIVQFLLPLGLLGLGVLLWIRRR